MIDIFLKAKHWQLFSLMIGIPLLFQAYFFMNIITAIETQADPDPKRIMDIFQVLPVVMIFFTSVFFGWFWSIAIGLNSVIPKDLRLNLKKFKIFFFVPLVYIIFFMIYIGGLVSSTETGRFSNSSYFTVLILPLHLFSMFCIFYLNYFVSKTIKTAELQKKVGFSDFAGEFFLLWFYFIGIWVIQPKVNKLYAEANQ